ncbi:hypothetical protein ACFYNN_28455 [Streptomyces sp. NPDC006978]|uniref:hypothetical protein n=1 Tax=Streptomyces sp. NPDC006978 TaxID=3364769 RepID=UPI003697373A
MHGYVTTGLWVSPWFEPTQVKDAEGQLFTSLYVEGLRLADRHTGPEEERMGFSRSLPGPLPCLGP